MQARKEIHPAAEQKAGMEFVSRDIPIGVSLLLALSSLQPEQPPAYGLQLQQPMRLDMLWLFRRNVMEISLPTIAGFISTALFALGTLPMLIKAFRTKNLASY